MLLRATSKAVNIALRIASFHLLNKKSTSTLQFLQTRLDMCCSQGYRLKMDAVAIFAGRIGCIGEVVFVAGSWDKPTIVEDDLFSFIRIERMALFAIQTSKRFAVQKMGAVGGKYGINKENKTGSNEQDVYFMSAYHDNLLQGAQPW